MICGCANGITQGSDFGVCSSFSTTRRCPASSPSARSTSTAMESIKTNLDAHQLTLAQSQEKGISVTGRGASSSYFEDLGSTNYVMESKDARNGKGSKKQGAVRNNSNVLLSDASSSEADDELNIHENSSLPGTPVVPVGKLSTYGLPYHENYPPKKIAKLQEEEEGQCAKPWIISEARKTMRTRLPLSWRSRQRKATPLATTKCIAYSPTFEIHVLWAVETSPCT